MLIDKTTQWEGEQSDKFYELQLTEEKVFSLVKSCIKNTLKTPFQIGNALQTCKQNLHSFEQKRKF